jgi:hypothetical protein
MKIKLRSVVIVYLALMLCALSATARIRSFEASRVQSRHNRLREVDFENLPLSSPSSLLSSPLTNPLTIDTVTFTDPATLRIGSCSAPTCIPDRDNPEGDNVELFVNPGGAISFATTPRLVVLDIQGMGVNPFVLLVTDTRGRTLRVQGQGVLFGQKLIGLFSNRGITNVQVVSIGGTGGPLPVARVSFSKK